MPRMRAAERAIWLKVTLKGVRPPIGRRLLVEDTMSSAPSTSRCRRRWAGRNSHLHLFLVGGEQIGDPGQLDDVADEARVTVGDLAGSGGKSFACIYDMGDDWEHTIEVEGSGPIEAGRAYPVCVGGRRACPPEDSGGPWGFTEIMEAVADPRHERHAEAKAWLGDFDPRAFSVDAAEARVRQWFAPKRARRPRGKR